jgi:hypothetical protein
VKYPVLDSIQVKEALPSILAGEAYSADAVCRWVDSPDGDGSRVDLDALDAALAPVLVDLDSHIAANGTGGDKEPLEGRLAAAVYVVLSALPPEVLDDRGFWNYLAVSRFAAFTRWREADAIDAGNGGTYFDVARAAEHVPLRLFLRAGAVNGDAELAAGIPKSTDFWRSHVTRVRTGSAVPLATAFAQMQKDDRLATDELRDFARRLNRTWTNVALGLADIDDSTALVAELRSQL